MSLIKIGPVNVEIIDSQCIISRTKELLKIGTPSQIVTINSLMFNFAFNDPKLAAVISSSVFAVPDSAGIVWAIKLLTGKSYCRVSGIDLIGNFCSLASDQGLNIFFLGGKHGVAETTSLKLKSLYPGLKIVGTHHGYFNESEEAEVIKTIGMSEADMLFVGMEIPRQEKWISLHLKSMNVPIVMGVGGSFDVLSGSLKRAPLWMQTTGSEWLFRLLQEPARILKTFRLLFFVLNILKIRIGLRAI